MRDVRPGKILFKYDMCVYKLSLLSWGVCVHTSTHVGASVCMCVHVCTHVGASVCMRGCCLCGSSGQREQLWCEQMSLLCHVSAMLASRCGTLAAASRPMAPKPLCWAFQTIAEIQCSPKELNCAGKSE